MFLVNYGICTFYHYSQPRVICLGSPMICWVIPRRFLSPSLCSSTKNWQTGWTIYNSSLRDKAPVCRKSIWTRWECVYICLIMDWFYVFIQIHSLIRSWAFWKCWFQNNFMPVGKQILKFMMSKQRFLPLMLMGGIFISVAWTLFGGQSSFVSF